MRIPNPLSLFWPHSTYHLGYDPVSREYKLLRFFFEGAHIMTLRPPSRSEPSWRVLNYYAAGISDLRVCSGGGLTEARTCRDDGLLCWFEGTRRCLCFDLNKEMFRVVELPQDVDQNGRVIKLCALTRSEDGLALWVAFYEQDFTVISCYVQEDDEGKKWRILKEVKENGRFAFVDGKLPSSSADGEMLLVDLDQPRRVCSFSFSHPQTVLFVGRLPEMAPALNTDDLGYIWKRGFNSNLGRMSCFTEANNLYLPLSDVLGGASASLAS